ncbi:Rho termination factor N-terminal domain-containing protein [Aliarcobacter butzleri]|uniref:Rho termination factor N-terminal domain-containing protein n=1 Tax=Aliarcobacter butzleri TaxID=28197 RepID=UPI00125EAF3A|nr:Rho termination factor N-terminal domain-containing protein [Aliarcobacter butzleri]
MKVKNISKGLIVLSVKIDKGYKAIVLTAGATSKDEDSEFIKESDILPYQKEKSLEVVEETLEGGNDKKDIDPVVLPDEVTEDTLKEISVDDLKRWCKENKIKGYSKLKEDELISLILESVKALKDEGKGED